MEKTGAERTLYTTQSPVCTADSESDWWLANGWIAVHPDGTIFAILGNEEITYCGESTDPCVNSDDVTTWVIGIDPDAGGVKFQVEIPELSYSPPTSGEPTGIIVAGDGYAYVSYTTTGDGQTYQLGLFRVNNNGAADDNGDIQTYQGAGPMPMIVRRPGPSGHSTTQASRRAAAQRPRFDPEDPWSGSSGVGGNMITNADQGVLLSWNGNGQTYIAITNGVSGSPISAPSGFSPVLQGEDGTFFGGYGEIDALDQSGSLLWTVPDDSPYIATADGGVIGTSGTMYDQNGNATGQMPNPPTYSWVGNAYRIGSVERIVPYPIFPALSLWANVGGSPSSNNSAGRPWFFKLIWENNCGPNHWDGTVTPWPCGFALYPSNPESMPQLAVDVSSQATTIKSAALTALKTAFAKYPVNVSEGAATSSTGTTAHGSKMGIASKTALIDAAGRWRSTNMTVGFGT